VGNRGTGRSAAAGRADCRKTVHSLNRGSGLGLVVLCAPALSFGDCPYEHQSVGDGVGAFVGPHVAGEPVWAEDVGGHPFQVGRGHAGGVQCFTDDRGPVGSVFGQGLAGPVAGDQDTTAADAECSRS
jgi:hypothetical protein